VTLGENCVLFLKKFLVARTIWPWAPKEFFYYMGPDRKPYLWSIGDFGDG
jgi:hypothetical protein